MSLATRLSAFFLSALALVLLGFAITLYVLARNYLYRQVDDRLGAALETLAAAVESGQEGLEWEPNEHHVTLGQDAGNDQVRWFICDGQGGLVDRSSNLAAEYPPTSNRFVRLAEEQAIEREEPPWRVLQRRVQGREVGVSDVGAPAGRNGKPDWAKPKYGTLVLTAAVSQVPVETTLHQLALTLAGLSGGLWAGAALLGRWLCRRALAPMTGMAATARAMSVTRWDQRLPNPGTGDELEDLSRAFNDLLSRLQEAFERQRRFTGDASHQLRTPLAAMLGQIEVILRRDRPTEEYRDALCRIHDQSVRLKQLVEMLLFLARADGETKLLDVQEVDFASWLEKYLQHWSDHPRAADLRLEQPVPGNLMVRVQPPLLGQLLDNLIDNACKYSQACSPITLRLGRESGQVTCTVEDRGSGIADTDLPHVFEPFYRSEHARRQGGTGVGLGLTVVQRIAAAFGGTVTAQSQPGQGSRFTLHLPEATILAEPAVAQECLT